MTIPSITDPAVRQALLGRMRQVRPDTRPLWGTMNAPQMLAHLNNSLRMGLGELAVAPKRTPIANRLGRWLLIYKLKWPQGTPTAPELLAPPRGDWDAELAAFGDLLERSGTRPADFPWPRHPAFGVMTGRDWSVLTAKHVNHHLTQFGA